MDNMLAFYIQRMKQQCVIQDAEYFDVKLEDGETVMECTGSAGLYEHRRQFLVRTKEDFIIRVTLNNWGGPMYFNGYVTVPSTLYHLTAWALDNPGYDDMNYAADLGVELTFCEGLEYGWDHAHMWDASLGRSLASQPHKHASGPVQVLAEARGVIVAMMAAEHRMCLQKMDAKREEMDTIREELMMKACHPRRIAAWCEVEFDAFE